MKTKRFKDIISNLSAPGIVIFGASILAGTAPVMGAGLQSVISVSTSVTISEVVDQIARNNSSLRVAAAENQAEVAAMKAGNVLGATSIEYSPFWGGGVDGLGSSELIIKQSMDFPTQYAARSKAADALGASLEENLQVEARKVRLDAVQACIDYIGVQHQKEILERRIAMTDSIHTLYERKLQRRTATQLEVNRISLTLQELRREALGNEVAAAKAIAAITLLNGGTPIDLSGLDYDPQIINIPASVGNSDAGELYLNDILSNRPELKAADADIAVADRELAVARNSWLPEISLGYRRNTDGNESLNGFLIGLDFSFFSAGKESKAVKARRVAAELQRETQQSLIKAELETTLTQISFLRKSIAATDTSLIEETLTLYAKSLELGQITLTDYCQETDILYTRLAERAALENELYSLASKIRY